MTRRSLLALAGIAVCVLLVGYWEKDRLDMEAAGKETGRSSYVSPDVSRGTPEPPLSASTLSYLKAEALKCGRLYTVVNLDGTLRCASLVPGIVWQPYQNAEEEAAIREATLRKLGRRMR